MADNILRRVNGLRFRSETGYQVSTRAGTVRSYVRGDQRKTWSGQYPQHAAVDEARSPHFNCRRQLSGGYVHILLKPQPVPPFANISCKRGSTLSVDTYFDSNSKKLC